MSGASMSPEHLRVHVDGVELNVADIGAGSPALVFLHYWGGSSRTWLPVMRRLATTHRCIAIDFRGWGESSKTASDHSLSTLASDVVGVVEALALTDFVLLGHSMGGKVAQLVAARQPEGLSALALYAPAPPTPMAVPEEVRRGYVDLYQTREGAEIVIRNLTPHALPEAVREQIIEDTLRGAPAAKRAWPLEGMTQDITMQAARIDVPVHLIAGGDDPVEPEASLRAAFGQVLRGVNIVVVPGVGHIAPLEAPAKLAHAIRLCVDGVTTRPPPQERASPRPALR